MRNAWAVVVLVGLALASITTLSLFHVTDAGLFEFVGACVVPTVSMMLVGRELSGQVDGVQQQVNGRMSQLIAKMPDATPPAPTPPEGTSTNG